MLYVDDTQVKQSFDFNDCLSSVLCVEKGVKTWMMSNKLQMNEVKTEVLLVTAKQIFNLQHLPKFMNINALVLNSALQLRTWALLSTALFRCISMS